MRQNCSVCLTKFPRPFAYSEEVVFCSQTNSTRMSSTLFYSPSSNSDLKDIVVSFICGFHVLSNVGK